MCLCEKGKGGGLRVKEGRGKRGEERSNINSTSLFVGRGRRKDKETCQNHHVGQKIEYNPRNNSNNIAIFFFFFFEGFLCCRHFL